MALYGHANLAVSETNIGDLVEAFLYDDISRMSSDQIHEFITSEAAQALMERSVLKKPTMIRLSKADDEKRRIKLTCYQLARDAKDPNWDKMIKYRTLMKKYRALIIKKYINKATRIAKIAQREYIKTAKSQPSTKADTMK